MGPTPNKRLPPEPDLHSPMERATLPPPDSLPGHPGSWLPCTVGTPLTCTGGCPWCPIALRGPHTRVREVMSGDRRLWASTTRRSRAMGTIGDDCPRAARATTPGPPPQPHCWVRLGLEASRPPHFWGGGQGICPGSLRRGVSGPLSSIFFLHILKQKRKRKTLDTGHRTDNREPQSCF